MSDGSSVDIDSAPKDGTKILMWFTPRVSNAGAVNWQDKPYSYHEPRWGIVYWSSDCWQPGDLTQVSDPRTWLDLPPRPEFMK